MSEIEEITTFVRQTKIVDSILVMENSLSLAIGYGQRVGELMNEAEQAYSVKRATCLERLSLAEDETETTRKAKLDAWVSQERKDLFDLKNLQTHLKALRFALMQAIKTRREEPR